MPFLHVQVSSPRTADSTQRITEMLLELTSRVLHKAPELTSIRVEYVDPADWSVSGQSLREQGLHTVYLNIGVTDETNTKDEKARYIAETFDGFRRLLGDLHEVSYILIHDVRATAYGYGGLTQERRYQLKH